MPGFDEDELKSAISAFYRLVPNEERQKLLKKGFRPESWNTIRGLTPFFENDGHHKEWFDVGCQLKDISDEALKMPLYEETPFPPQEEF